MVALVVQRRLLPPGDRHGHEHMHLYPYMYMHVYMFIHTHTTPPPSRRSSWPE